MSEKLGDLLENKRCFKLICGAGNENLKEVERLVAVYAAAGCRFFDLANSEEALQAAQLGLDFAIPKEEQENYHFCVSVGTKGDQHLQKARINQDICKRCEQCRIACPQKAINQYLKVIKEKCIGCLKCKLACKHNAIEIYSENKPLNFSTFKLFRPTCIEFHASDANEDEVDKIWDDLNKNFDGILSICLGRGKLSNEKVVNRVKRFIAQRKPYTTIIQTDGSPMSGGADDYKTTLQAVAMAEIIQNEKLPVYLILSGGTNSKTAELANQCGVNFNGIAFGSYARKIVREYIEQEDFLENKEIFCKAQQAAKALIDSVFV